ncbi:ABC transporter G family member 5 [Abeliophyllum distichum]|uniref:ABC transporter G family member 5 n=1 Tax=Abeliophyllum distichum TaxID=126358 RepID=A0ABD1SEG7_9LAMI
MKKKGCEIEALGINYTIHTHKREQQENVHKVVLKDVNLRAKPWEILAIVGPSGAGKSSLLEILAGKVTPQSASVYVNHKPLDKAQFKRISGYVTQKDTLFPLLTVEETLTFSAKIAVKASEYGIELKGEVFDSGTGLESCCWSASRGRQGQGDFRWREAACLHWCGGDT